MGAPFRSSRWPSRAPVRIVGNALAFKINTDPINDAEWRAFMEERGIVIGQSKVDLVPLSSGGIFAEAVLGRFNCAERLDLTRFFNWQDSPIPIQPTEIAAVQTGTRATAEDLKPGQLSAPLVSITPPAALPDPTGLAGTLAAIQNANLFRDMSGLAQTVQLATETGKLSAAGATAAGSQAVEAFKISADLQKAKTLTEKGATVAKEEDLKKKQEAEAAKKTTGSSGGGTSPSGGGEGGSVTPAGSGGASAGGAPSKPVAPASTGNSALDAIIGNPAALRSFIGQSPDSPEPTRTVTAEGVPLQEWDAVGTGGLLARNDENSPVEAASQADIETLVASGLWRPAALEDVRSALLGDRQFSVTSLGKLLVPLSLAPAGSVKALNIVAHARGGRTLAFLQDVVIDREQGIPTLPQIAAAEEAGLGPVDLSELVSLAATPELSVDSVTVKLSDVRKAFPVDAEVRVFNLSNPLREDFIQALANIFQVRTSGFVSKPVRVLAKLISETEAEEPILSKKVNVGLAGEQATTSVDFFTNLLQQDRGQTGLFTAFPRRG